MQALSHLMAISHQAPITTILPTAGKQAILQKGREDARHTRKVINRIFVLVGDVSLSMNSPCFRVSPDSLGRAFVQTAPQGSVARATVRSAHPPKISAALFQSVCRTCSSGYRG
ncbi:unnamed protein product [Lota lota]